MKATRVSPCATADDAGLPGQKELMTLLRGQDPVTDEGWLEFFIVDRDLYVLVSLDAVLARLRIRVYLPTDERTLVEQWVKTQPSPASGILETSSLDPDEWRPRLVFERPSSNDWVEDPIAQDVATFADAWATDVTTPPASNYGTSWRPVQDPLALEPANAWLLKGDEPSFPTDDQLRAQRNSARVGIYDLSWTVAPHTRAGDLVLIYFMSPRKAVHFVARAAADAYFSRDIEVNAVGDVAAAQWWAPLTPLVPVDPISLHRLTQAVGGYLPLRGRSGQYLRPEVIKVLDFTPGGPDLEAVIRVPVGLADLPSDATMTLAQWRSIAAGVLTLEARVESYVVEPLLRLLLEDSSIMWERQFRIGRRLADYVLTEDGHPVHVIEVKKAVRRGRHGWAGSPDLEQVRWYAEQLGVPATLMDANRICLLGAGASEPHAEIDRNMVTEDDIVVIRRHLLDES